MCTFTLIERQHLQTSIARCIAKNKDYKRLNHILVQILGIVFREADGELIQDIDIWIILSP
jgi:hypothetical protein